MKPPRLVLLRPRNADNLGAIARAMKNFGLSDWVVVSPNPKLLEAPGLNRLAVKSADLVDAVRRVDTLHEAIADCTWVVGTTMRLIEGQRRLTPRELTAEAIERDDAQWALVFGDERNGPGQRRSRLVPRALVHTHPATRNRRSTWRRR
jgi:tRNA C32,U32 (ribose-2'-O)-methylase TrmJ